MTEHECVAELQRTIRQSWPNSAMGYPVVIKISNYVMAGVPDLTVTWNGKTTWWEVKLAKPRIKGTGLQLDTARRLEERGYCRYIVFQEKPLMVHVVRPSQVGENGYWVSEISFEGHDHLALLRQIAIAHGAKA